MPDQLEQALSVYGQTLAASTPEPIRPPDESDVPSDDRHRRHGRVMLAVAAVTLLVVGGGVVWLTGRDGDTGRVDDAPATSPADDTTVVTEPSIPATSSPVTAVVTEPPATQPTSEPPVDSTTPDLDDWMTAIAPDSTATLPPAPIDGRRNPAAVWTGSEMIAWGGSSDDSPTFDDGAAFDPHRGTWRMIADAPIAGRTWAATVWTGSEMIVWGGGDADGNYFTDGAAYDPASDTWRTPPQAPITAVGLPRAVWTGDEMVLFAPGGGEPATGPLNRAAAYDPVTDTWRRLSDSAPGFTLSVQPHWTGDTIVMLGMLRSRASDGSAEPIRHFVVTFDPETDTWTSEHEIPTPAASVHVDGVPVFGDEHAILVVDLTGSVRVFDRHGDPLGEIAAPPEELLETGTQLGWARPIWTGREMLIWGGPTIGMALDPVTQTWRTSIASIAGNLGALLWADGVVLAWGRGTSIDQDGTPTTSATGLAYRPPDQFDVA